MPLSLEALYARDDGLCWLCGDAVPTPGSVPDHDPGGPSRDHVVPRSRRGRNPRSMLDHPAFLRLAHASCNMERGNPIPSWSDIDWGEVAATQNGPMVARRVLGRFSDWWVKTGNCPREVLDFLHGGTDRVPCPI